jgi:hypothetical protein
VFVVATTLFASFGAPVVQAVKESPIKVVIAKVENMVMVVVSGA